VGPSGKERIQPGSVHTGILELNAEALRICNRSKRPVKHTRSRCSSPIVPPGELTDKTRVAPWKWPDYDYDVAIAANSLVVKGRPS